MGNREIYKLHNVWAEVLNIYLPKEQKITLIGGFEPSFGTGYDGGYVRSEICDHIDIIRKEELDNDR
jgi:hypothetical protein